MTETVISNLVKREDLMRLRPLWSSIAQDIVMTKVPDAEGTGTLTTPESVCKNYNMTEAECIALLRLPEFQRMVKDYRKRVDAMGDNASITLRAQMLASSMMEQVYLEGMTSNAELKDKIRIMEKFFQYGNLDPATNGQNKTKGEGENVAAIGQVIIQIPAGVPGLDHLRGKTINGETE